MNRLFARFDRALHRPNGEETGASLTCAENERTWAACLSQTKYRKKDVCTRLIEYACKQTEEQTDMKSVSHQSSNGSMDQPQTGDLGE